MNEHRIIVSDEILGEINEGTEMSGGEVNDKINYLHERIMMADIGKASEVKECPLFEKPFNFFSSYIHLSE